ncbi:MAG: ribulose-phosphate 3-epimerase [Clostridium sp.]|jgi:ribulose-phosphate 3-epimerase|uniref:ribulose-phosphate 3-epimerase n=1 Tax=Clostridium sp. TaxID=1506 RepID=UPI0025C22D44|nr:ribulose-phosphate 3-epimerase [Clostridium sp.]MCH3964946.1 ribulose-phosphate 3-epimerase [Clostridium sp.]MCI1716560.1 ribulose-phosphate 3-epimerase [Clostridium sp.]MCI1800958.1 ribulose-phosphate 3-epimerase [Clostridium sp.]MCI1814737.1 ribulose-phosphate 3-epimerase [Clostridium sp.]MCI1871705.1 ribulose-phosphate 3-epimerase [Clostridium sp.]
MIKVIKNDINISASVSCMDLCNLKKSMLEVEQSEVSFYHFDVVDGKFNSCFILGEPTLRSMRRETNLPVEVHLAVYEPEKFIKAYASAGADYIAVHYEAVGDFEKIFDMIRRYGAEPVLAYKASTAPGDDFISLAGEAAWILKLTVNPGFPGQKMQEDAAVHIEQMRRMLNRAGLKTGIQADGNINENTIPSVVRAGADMMTGGTSGLFLKDRTVKESCSRMLCVARKYK